MAELQGIITGITYQNEESGFTVMKLQCERTETLTACVGIMPTVEQGEAVRVKGEWRNDPRWGPQFAVKAYELVRPATLKGITLLLSSGLIANIGPQRAERISETFGVETLDILDNEPERLTEVSGIGKKRMATIVQAWRRHRDIRELLLFLQEFGVSVNMVSKIYRAYGEHAKEVISSNPYALIDDIWGVGFKKADAVAQKLGFKQDSYRRIRAGIIHTLQVAAQEGHSYLPRQECTERATDILGVQQELVLFSIDNVVERKSIIADDDRLYLPPYFYAEKAVAKMIGERIEGEAGSRKMIATSKLNEWLDRHKTRTGWTPDPRQVDAVRMATGGGMMLLTGGPGTGKTTTLRVIVSFFRERSLRVALAAPTGRAAQRMGTIAGLNAKTIHRLLEYRPQKGGTLFARNQDNPLEMDVVIIDEVSMIDLMLMKNLLAALPKAGSVILVGDSNQLPSVGTGNVLADLIAARVVPHVRLETIFRQASQSRIVTAAHEIIHGSVPEFDNGRDDDCFFVVREDPEECLDTVVDLVSRRLPDRYSIDPIRDIQVLSPMHRGQIGTQILNQLLQQKLNDSTRKITRGDVRYCVGDKVMQIRNNYERGVFNGDIGFITALVEDEGIAVGYDEHVVRYGLSDLDEITHAYCISIHKSQGCEFSTVVIPVMTQHYVMLQRNLIYTALTRARKRCVLIGMPKALGIAVRNNEAQHRYSWLAERLQKEAEP
ncbi:MAG: ATP-dependent RecD-like DNA helicase [Chitinivibrionales bacterium]|nr:ATP-dependent RecD-like DNA helicase [Chitinivibrionales bacterium]MBD3356146.1 ATP-dependent RecD-like DNA helicase [Chitinivibrionales bacterium]